MDYSDLYDIYFEGRLADIRHARDSSGTMVHFYDDAPRIFDFGDPEHKASLYERLRDYGERTSVIYLYELLKKMLSLANVPFAPGDERQNRSGLSTGLRVRFILNEEDKEVGYVLSAYPQFEKALKAQLDSENLGAICNIVILEETPAIARIITQDNAAPDGISYMTLKAFFARFFDDGEYERFVERAKEFNEDARRAIGYGVHVAPTLETMATRREKSRDDLIAHAKATRAALASEGIYPDQCNRLWSNYVDKGLYLAMVGDGTYADSFMSSEWLHGLEVPADCVDQTLVVAGYLKSIEQLLDKIAGFSKNTGRYRSTPKRKRVEYNDENERVIDNSLGALHYYLDDWNNDDLFDVNWHVKNLILERVDDWRKKHRNGYFHKDNLHDPAVVEEIRSRAMELYFLILGGCKIDDAHKAELGIRQRVNGTEPLDALFSSWLLGAIRQASLSADYTHEWVDLFLSLDTSYPSDYSDLKNGALDSEKHWEVMFSIRDSDIEATSAFDESNAVYNHGDWFKMACRGTVEDAKKALFELARSTLDKNGMQDVPLRVTYPTAHDIATLPGNSHKAKQS